MLLANSESFFINGPVGKLECLKIIPNNLSVVGVAIIFHPDPIGGGTYNNKVVQTLAKSLNNKNYISYCPNLRGTGLSEGKHDNGIGEIIDAQIIYNYVLSQHKNLPIILAGFSFGCTIANKLAENVHYTKLILVAPAIHRFNLKIKDTSKTIIIHGENDELISLPIILNWANICNQSIIVIPNSSHFFHNKLINIRDIINNLSI